MNDDIPPTPPAHILMKCDMILQDLVIQQQNLDKIFADGWPTSNRSAGRTPKPSRSHSCRAPLPGDLFVELLIRHEVQTPLLRRAPLVATELNDGPLSNVGPVDSPSLHQSPCVEAKTKYNMMIRQHEAAVAIKREKKKPSYLTSIVPKVCSADLFYCT